MTPGTRSTDDASTPPPTTVGGVPAWRRVERPSILDGSSGRWAVAGEAATDRVALGAWAVVTAVREGRSDLELTVATGTGLVEVEVHLDDGLTFARLVDQISTELAATTAATIAPAPEPTAHAFVLAPGRGALLRGASGPALSLGLEQTDRAVILAGCYDPARLDEATVTRLLDEVATVLDAVAGCDGQVPVGDIEVASPAERDLLDQWNATAVHAETSDHLLSLFPEAAAALAPGARAVELGDVVVTRRELATLVARVSGELAARGIGPGSLVGVMGERSLEVLVGVHAVATTGAAYLPLDPDLPDARIAHMLRESGAGMVLQQAALADRAIGAEVTAVDLDAVIAGGARSRPSSGAPAGPSLDDEVAYVMFTSGSSGRPKGVANTRRGVANRLLWMQERFPLGPDDAVLWKTPFGFDVSVWELFWPLQVGARLVVASPGGHRDPGYLVETIVGHHVTTAHFVPSMLRLFLDHPRAATCTSLRRVICSGEAMPRDLVTTFFDTLPGVELHNLYGPTEAAIDVTAWECVPGEPGDVVPIGAPVANTTIRILDRRMRQVPIGVAGELHIGGVQVGLGYVGRDELTAERFVPDPFDPGGRLYRTGDLARWSPDGQVEFLGRLDTQVKVRGQRIELGEIEAVLAEHPSVRGAAVTVVERGGEPALVAHVTTRGDPPGQAELRTFLAHRLPETMIPSRIVHHDELPLTTSGKVDRRTLDRPVPQTRILRSAPDAGNEVERLLIDLWCTVLDRPDIGRSDDVAELGATSLQAAAFVNQVQRELDEFIYVVSVFLAPTVADYAAFLARDYPEAVARRFGAAPGPAPAARVQVDEPALRALADLVPRVGPHGSWPVGPPNPPTAFILSPPRSGTTLLRVMLAGHPGVFAAPELQLLGFDTLAERSAALVGRFSPWREGALRAVMELEGCDADEAEEIVVSQERAGVSTKDFYRWLQERAGGRLVIDKSPSYALDPDALRHAEEGFTSPRYIHLVRDPLAMSRSFESYHMDQIMFLRDHSWPGRTLGELVWTLSHRNILALAEQVPEERMLRIRFEDLVSDPRPVMTRVASFLGLDFDESLVHPYEGIETKMVDGLHVESTPMGDTRLLERDRIDPNVVRRWEQPGEDSPLGRPTRELARRLGYPTSALSSRAGAQRSHANDMRRRRGRRSADG